MSLRVFYAYLSFMQAYLNCLAAEDGMVRWHHRLSGRESEQALGDWEGQGSLACCRPWSQRAGHDWATEQQVSYPLFVGCICVAFDLKCVYLRAGGLIQGSLKGLTVPFWFTLADPAKDPSPCGAVVRALGCSLPGAPSALGGGAPGLQREEGAGAGWPGGERG